MCLFNAFPTAAVYRLQPFKRRYNAALQRTARLPQTLAFWALWHCRHARPPDACAPR